MITLNAAQRRELKARAHALNPVVMISDAGLTPSVLHEIDVSLKSHELIKIRVFGDDRVARAAMVEDISTKLDAALVQHIGKILVLYRPRPEAPPGLLPRGAFGLLAAVTKETTEGITVEVESYFVPEQSDAVLDRYVFAYRIRIHNRSAVTVQLTRRHWIIAEGDGSTVTVNGIAKMYSTDGMTIT